MEKEQDREARRFTRRQDRAKGLTGLLAEELDLSDAQQREVERIFADEFTRYRELKDAADDAPGRGVVTPRQKQERKERIRRETQEETDRQLAGVLSAQQMELLREIREEEGLRPGG
jgi:hypothetical protein